MGWWSSRSFLLSGFWGGGAGPETEAVVSRFEDVAVVGDPIQQGRRHLGVAEDTCPLAETEIGGDDDAYALVEFTEQVEQQRPARRAERQIS